MSDAVARSSRVDARSVRLVLQEVFPSMSTNAAFELSIQLVQTLPQHREFTLIEPGGELSLNADREFLNVLVNLAPLCREAEAGTTPVLFVDVAPDEAAADQQLDRASNLEGIG